jgi:hypothetical protein
MEGSSCHLSKLPSQLLFVRTKENMLNSFRIAGATEQLLNTRLEHYCYTNQYWQKSISFHPNTSDISGTEEWSFTCYFAHIFKTVVKNGHHLIY